MKRILDIIRVFTLILTILAILDWYIIPLVLGLTVDRCYYHNNPAPFLIRILFLDDTAHTDPPFSFLNVCLLLMTSGVATSFVMKNKLFDQFINWDSD
jgi:hypothetical protein